MDGSVRFFKEIAAPQAQMSYFLHLQPTYATTAAHFIVSILDLEKVKVLNHFLIILFFSGQNYVQSDPQQRLVKLKVGGRAKVFRQGFQSYRFYLSNRVSKNNNVVLLPENLRAHLQLSV